MRRGSVIALAAAGVLMAACTRDVVPRSAAGPVTVPQQTVPADATSTTSSTTSTTAPAAAAPAGLGQGDRGPEVRALETRLRNLRFTVGTVDDTFDVNTAYAVQAFEKSVGLPRDGRATPAVTSRLATATLEKPLVHGGPPTRVEIDISRQILFLYEGGSLSEILPVSTGSGRPFCVKGLCGDATTPTGSFKVNYQKQGWDLSPLGRLYNPLYFNGGIAIHGFPSVPTTPASHGCVRIPMAAAEWFPDRAPVGTPVFVV